MTYIRFFIALSLLVSSVALGYAQSGELDEYIRIGLDSNLVIQEKNLNLDRALNALQVAKSQYLPSIAFDLTYTHSDGGRAIDLPVGDMLNPVYETLNRLTESQSFPSIQNEQINFLPKHYYDTRIRTTVPIINADIKHYKEIRNRSYRLQQSELDTYKRELIKNIKEAYYHYLTALNAVEIYKSSLGLAREGKRVNQKMFDAGKSLPVYVLRSDAEIAQAESKVAESEEQLKNSQYYFNMLLNRSPHDPILIAINLTQADTLTLRSMDGMLGNREEHHQLQLLKEIKEEELAMSKNVFIPKLNAFADLGAQAERMRFDKHAPYYLVGAQISFPIFSGNRNRLKIQESHVELAEAKNKAAQAEQQIQLSTNIARNAVYTAYKNYLTAITQLQAAENYYRLIQRGFNEGINTYIETIDARNQLTLAQLSKNIAAYKFLSTTAKLERETASYPLSTYETKN